MFCWFSLPPFLRLRAVDAAVVDVVDDVVGRATVDGAADGLRGAEDLLHDAREVARVGAGPHDARRVDDVVHRDVAVVLDVLHLLAVARRLLQRLDDEGCGRGDDLDLGLPVLDGELLAPLLRL